MSLKGFLRESKEAPYPGARWVAILAVPGGVFAAIGALLSLFLGFHVVPVFFYLISLLLFSITTLILMNAVEWFLVNQRTEQNNSNEPVSETGSERSNETQL